MLQLRRELEQSFGASHANMAERHRLAAGLEKQQHEHELRVRELETKARQDIGTLHRRTAMQDSVIRDTRSELASKGLLSDPQVSAIHSKTSTLRDEQFGDELRSKDEAILRIRTEFTEQQQAKQERWANLLRETQNRYRAELAACLLYTSPSPRDRQKSRMPSSA